MKLLTPLVASIVLLAGCNQKAPSAPSQSTSTPSVVAPRPVAPSPQAPTPNHDPLISQVFTNVQECVKGGYGEPQCQRALSTAQAMWKLDTPIYSSKAECEKLFSNCMNASRSSPLMVMFSMGDEPKTQGDPPKATPQAPLRHMPIYLDVKREAVFVKALANGKFEVIPIASKKD